jgi:hypothetical protein
MRQADVAQAGVSRSQVSRIERGLIDAIPVADLARVAARLGADLDVRLRWHGEGLDRLLDAAHAALVEAIVRMLRERGWEVAVEVSYNVAGERGSIDVLGFHTATSTLLVIEVKSVMPDAQALLFGLDRKARIAPTIAAQRGWRVRHSARLIVLGESSTSRRRVHLLGQTFAASFPQRGRAVQAWLHAPLGPLSGLLFLPYDRGAARSRGIAARQRVRKREREAGSARSTATRSLS